MDVNTRRLVWTIGLTLRRAAWQRHRRLVRELADYRTPAERDDLLASIERCPRAGREEIRRLLMGTAARADADRTSYHLRT